ncbi:MAG: SyrP protein [Gammaproteobacteria bacterium]|mgnify:CR=1 FL=1|nr:SyrP protein [Gammaproteobacteria bacterium]
MIGFFQAETTNPEEWLQDNRKEIDQYLKDSGGVLVRGLNLRSAESFDKFVTAFGLDSFSYRESLSNAVRVDLTPRVFTANEAPGNIEIHLHHEMAQTPYSPQILFFCCIRAAQFGGATPVCRSDLLFEAFERIHPKWTKKLAREGIIYTTLMPGTNEEKSGQGRSWRSTLRVNSADEAEKRLTTLGFSSEWRGKKLVVRSPVLPAVIDLPGGGRSFYHQLIAAHMGWPWIHDDPELGLKFGSGAIIPSRLLDSMTELSQNFTQDLDWEDGDFAMLNNKMIMHGRRPYFGEGKRHVLVSMS